MDAKRALEASHGRLPAAIEYLRSHGQKIAAAKSSRQATEGVIGVWVSPDRRHGALVAVACETDFVSRTPEFQALAAQLASHLGSLTTTLTAEQFLDQPGPNGAATVRQSLTSVIARLGENILVPKIAVLSAASGAIDSYLHANRKLAALVAVQGGPADVGHDLAMHVAALNPAYLAPSDVPAAVLAGEQAIYREQLRHEGKPPAMWDKILPGKLQKFYAADCLLDQPFVKDDQLTVRRYLQQSGGVRVTAFIRLAMSSDRHD